MARSTIWFVFILAIVLLMTPASLVAQALAGFDGWCTTGGQKVQTSGIMSSTLVQASYPTCTVTVFVSGTTTLATIYSNSSGTPLSNPFTASTNGFWIFWASPASLVDVQLSGGTPPFPAPVTLSALPGNNFGGGAGGGGGGGGTVTNNGLLAQGQPVYGYANTVIQTVPTELAADIFPGADICAQIMAAQATLPANGGVIRLSAKNYPACANTLILNQGKSGVTLRGAGGPGNWGLSTAATVLNFAAGVSGIVGTSGYDSMNIENLYIKSASTTAGTDDGITLIGGSPRISRVTVQGFGHNGIVFGENTDLWRMENVYADSNKNDGFYWTASCHDENAGTATVLSATNNKNYGYELQCGGANNFQNTHASANVGGAWLVNVSYNFFYDTYVEQGVGSTFTFTASSAYNTAFFSGFGQPTITDLGVYSANTIYYEGGGGTDGIYPSFTSFSLTGKPQQSPGVMYSFIAGSGGYYAGDFILRERVSGKNLFFYANNIGWDFLQPLILGLDNQTAGKLTIANGSLAAHTVIQTQATSNTAFNLPATNGVSGQALITDGAGNTTWGTVATGPGGGLTSINTDTTPAQSLIAGTNITITNNGTGGHTINATTGGITNSAPNNVLMKSNGTNAVTSSMTDTGTTVTTTEPLNAATLSTGAGASGCPAIGCFALTEASTAGTPTPGNTYCRADSATHTLMCSLGGGTEAPLGGSSGTPSFSVITAGTNPNPLVMGTGGSLTTSGTGTIAATSVPATGIGAGTIANNTSGTASNLSGTPALPNGITATTQTTGDNSAKLATDAFVIANASSSGGPNPTNTQLIEYFCSGITTTGNVGNLAWSVNTVGSAPAIGGISGTYPHRCILSFSTATTATQGQGGTLALTSASGNQPWGDFSSNPGWTIHATFSLQSIVSSIMRIGLSNLVTSGIRPAGMFLMYDTNSPLSAAAISTLTCTTAVCTVTMAAAHNLTYVGTSFTLTGTSCPNRGSTLNTTYAFGTATGVATIPNATSFVFNSSGLADTCTAATGTVTTNPQVNFGYATLLGTLAQGGTVVDSGIPADTSWHNITISNSTAGTIQFKLDNGSTTSISTGVPASGLLPFFAIGTDITAQKSVQLNYWSYIETGVNR